MLLLLILVLLTDGWKALLLLFALQVLMICFLGRPNSSQLRVRMRDQPRKRESGPGEVAVLARAPPEWGGAFGVPGGMAASSDQSAAASAAANSAADESAGS